MTPASDKAPLVEERRHGFTAGAALYPACADRYGTWATTREQGNRGAVTDYSGVYKPIGSLLILVGERDDWTPAKPCEELNARAQAAGYPISIKVYPGAPHGWLNDTMPGRYRRAQAEAAWALQLAFLERVLNPGYNRARRLQIYECDHSADYDFTKNVRME